MEYLKDHPKERETRKKAVSNEILEIMKKTQQAMPRNGTKYKILKKYHIQMQASKNEWLNKKSSEIEKQCQCTCSRHS